VVVRLANGSGAAVYICKCEEIDSGWAEEINVVFRMKGRNPGNLVHLLLAFNTFISCFLVYGLPGVYILEIPPPPPPGKGEISADVV
jgi:hypothetical protein